MDRFSKRLKDRYIYIILLFLISGGHTFSQLIISEISPNAEVEALEQYGGGEWFEICNVGQDDMDISGYTIGHYEDASFGQSDFYLGTENDNCDCGGSYGVITFIGSSQSQDVILPAGKCLIITGQNVDCGNSAFCINARDLLLNGPSGIVAEYHSSRSDYPGSGNGNGKGALEGHYWRQKNYECNAYYIWNTDDEIIDAVNYNCLPQTGPDIEANKLSGGFHYPDGNGGYYSYPPHFPTPPAQGPFPVGIEITNTAYTWVGQSIEEGFTFQRCSNDPNFVFPPMKYDPQTGQPSDNYYQPTCGELNDNCCSECDESQYFQGVQLPSCTNGSAIGLVIEANEVMAEMEVLSSVAPSCNNTESRLRSNYDENEISFCTPVKTPANFARPFVGFVNSLDQEFVANDCAVFTGAEVYKTSDCSQPFIPGSLSSKGRAIFQLDEDSEYTLCFNYNISDCSFKNRIYWDNPCFSPFYCQLDVICPVSLQDTIDCIAEVPTAVTDTIAFRTELGGTILSSCDDVTISHSDSLGAAFDPHHTRILYRTYLLMDGLDSSYCTLEYPIRNRIAPILELNTDTVFLDPDGLLSLTPQLFIERAYDTCGDTVETASIIPEIIDGSNLGSTEIIVSVIDSAGNSTMDTIDIVVGDNTPPMVVCPNDTLIMVAACVCEGSYSFMDPLAVDELGGPVTIERLDSTGLVDGDLFPAGTTTIIYSATDESGNETICSYDVTVESGDPGPIVLKASVNFSLSEICDGYPTPAMLIEGIMPCMADSYIVTVFDENGDPIAEDSLRNHRNTPLVVRLEYVCFNNFDETNILIEDKFKPVISCFSDTISCEEFFNFEIPDVSDNCDNDVEIVLLNEVLENVACTDPNLTRIITRTYTAIDDDGRRSDTCFQVLSIAKFDLSSVSFNGIDTLIYCGDIDELDDNGNPSPSVTGYPTAGNTSLWPDQNSICGVTSSYTDIVIPGTSCGYSILREWNVMYWDCFQDGMRQFFQTINITDNVAPSFTCPAAITIETDPFTCTAMLNADLPLAVDACNNGVTFDIDYPNTFIENASTISQQLELGLNEIEISSKDICGNISSCIWEVTVIDNEDPIAIVQGSFEINLTGNQITVSADELDNGSFDECGFVDFSVARMEAPCDTSDLILSDDIHICCEDVGTTVMVMFQVVDGSGNTSIAMIGIEVEDISGPSLVIDLPDITVSCDYQYIPGQTQDFGKFVGNAIDRDSIIIEADSVEFSGPTLEGLVSENCSMIVTEEIINEDVDSQCGTGSVTRMITITDGSDNSISLFQTINFVNYFPFDENDIIWPSDFVENNVCDPSQLEPENLSAPFDIPVTTDDSCDNIADSKLDDIDYGPFESDTLFIINRQWAIADWCQNTNGQFATFNHTQIITVLNTIEPTISGGCSTINECNFSPVCADLDIDIEINAMDDCTPNENISYSYSIDFDTDNSADVTGNSNSATIAFPLGTHLITWIATDAQGNSDMCFQEVQVDNCNLPSPICLAGQEFALVGVDTDGNGGIDDEQITIHVDQIDGGSSIACDVPFTLSLSTDTTVVDTIFDCDGIGTHLLSLYVTDNITGAQDFCQVLVDVIDTNDVDICIPTTSQAKIFGLVKSELDKSTNDVKLELEGTDMQVSSEEGNYQFPAMPLGGAYNLKPSHETYPLDGITTYDILLIQKHILGLKVLDSPYKILAADADGSENISGADIIYLRKLILGDISEFSNQSSWQFVWKDQTFIDQYNPWLNNDNFYEIPALNEDMEIDFISIKTGDVNHSSPNLTNEIIDTRSVSTMEYDLINNNDEIIIPVKIDDQKNIEGFQFSFRYNDDAYEFKELISGNISITNEMISEKDINLGVIDLSWISPDGEACNYCDENYNKAVDNKSGAFAQREVSFYLVFEKVNNSVNTPSIGLETFSEGLTAEVYRNDGSIHSLIFSRISEDNPDVLLYQNKPNPWKSNTLISFFLPEAIHASLVINDITGREVYRKSARFGAGMNEIEVMAETLGTAGIYYYSLQTAKTKYMKKMILIE